MKLLHGDCREVLRDLPAGSIDSCVTDPPYHLTSIVKRFGAPDAVPAKVGATGVYARSSAGFMGQQWDGGDVAFQVETWREVFRVLKPGSHLVAFGGTRTYHRMVCAIEDAGFEVRDQIGWVYGSGFPKGLNVVNHLIKLAVCQSSRLAPVAVQSSAPIQVSSPRDKESIVAALVQILPEGGQALLTAIGGEVALHVPTGMWLFELEMTIGLNTTWSWNGNLNDACVEVNKCITSTTEGTITDQRTFNSLIGLHTSATTILCSATLPNGSPWPAISVAMSLNEDVTSKNVIPIVTALGPATWNPVARFDGFNLALKPAHEPIVLARKPLIGTVADNVVAHGVGAINIGGCRVEGESTIRNNHGGGNPERWRTGNQGDFVSGSPLARWPANLIHDGSDEVLALFPVAPGQQGKASSNPDSPRTRKVYGKFQRADDPMVPRGDTGSAARFFYCAKATKADRGPANGHPTVKPTDLMRYLCRLVTPPGGTVLDPFMGSGSTGRGALLEGFSFTGIEAQGDYLAIARQRVADAYVAWLEGE